jgi:hypothetical protein
MKAMSFNCEFEHRDTGECKLILSTLSSEEVRSVKALTKDAELIAMAMALRHAYREVPTGFLHSKPPELIRLS